MNALFDCVWKQHSVAISHPFNHLYGRLMQYLPNSMDASSTHLITSMVCAICHARR